MFLFMKCFGMRTQYEQRKIKSRDTLHAAQVQSCGLNGVGLSLYPIY